MSATFRGYINVAIIERDIEGDYLREDYIP